MGSAPGPALGATSNCAARLGHGATAGKSARLRTAAVACCRLAGGTPTPAPASNCCCAAPSLSAVTQMHAWLGQLLALAPGVALPWNVAACCIERHCACHCHVVAQRTHVQKRRWPCAHGRRHFRKKERNTCVISCTSCSLCDIAPPSAVSGSRCMQSVLASLTSSRLPAGIPALVHGHLGRCAAHLCLLGLAEADMSCAFTICLLQALPRLCVAALMHTAGPPVVQMQRSPRSIA